MNATVHHWETEPTGDVDTDIDMNTVIVSILFTITVRNWFMQLWTLRSPRSEVSKLEISQWCKSQTWAESEDWYPSSKKGRESLTTQSSILFQLSTDWMRPTHPGEGNLLYSVSLLSSLSRVRLFATPWTEACQASLSFTISRSLLKLMSIESSSPQTISSSVDPFSFCPQSFPASGSFPIMLIGN